MDIFNHYTTQHLDSVAFVFHKYGVKASPTPRNLRLAILAGKDTNFYQDLLNAIRKRAIGHSKYEDEYNYYLVDMHEDNFDGEVVGILDTFEMDYADRSARKAKRKQKKVVRQQKKQAKKDERSAKRATRSESGGVSDAEMVEDAGSGGLSVGEKIEKAFSVIGGVATSAANVAGQFIGGGSSESGAASDGVEYRQDGTPVESPTKKYLPYIIGGVVLLVLVGGLIFFLKRKK